MPGRASKELRTLLLPSGLILAATALAALWSDASRPFNQLAMSVAAASFFVGTPLIAAWSLGAEFQQRTLVLLLTQPVSRSRLWLEKWLVLALVIALLMAIQFASLNVGPFEAESSSRLRYLWVAAMLCGTPLWTLVARSTIGGLAFSMAAAMVPELVASFILHGLSASSPARVMFQDVRVLNGFRVAYCVGTFAAGWWMFSRLQVAPFDHPSSAGGTVGSVPLFRYRPSGLLRNLLITEMRTYRPLWLLALGFSGGGLAVLAVSRAGFLNHTVTDVVTATLIGAYLPVAVVLAGTLSISEDVTLGIHAWRLTLPLATRTQWLIKVTVSLLAALIAVILIPTAMWTLASNAFGLVVTGRPPFVRADALLMLVALVVLCFWAATLFGHTVRAAAAAGVMLLVFAVCWTIAVRIGYRLEVLDGVMTSLMVRWHVPPDYFFSLGMMSLATADAALVASIPGAVGLTALLQSLRAFRRARTSRTGIAVHVLGLASVMFLASFAAFNYVSSVDRLERSQPVMELRGAVQHLALATPAEGQRELRLDELDATGILSPRTKRWLDGSSVTLERAGRSRRGGWAYNVAVHFPGERSYRFRIDVSGVSPAPPR